MIELKYIKKGEYTESGDKAVEAKLAEATAQLNRYAPAPELTALPKLKKMGAYLCRRQVRCE
jgi:hypothetical protein